MAYTKLLEDELFMKGEVRGRLATTTTILTDMLIDLNSLELFYQKPSSKSITPAEIGELRIKINKAKQLLYEALTTKD